MDTKLDYKRISDMAGSTPPRTYCLDAKTVYVCLALLAVYEQKWLWVVDDNKPTDAELDEIKETVAASIERLMSPVGSC